MIFFEATDKTGRKLYLSKERWGHIRKKHPNVANVEDIEDTLQNPLKIIQIEEGSVAYYKYFKHKLESAKYLKVIVKYLNGEGYVISSYFVKNMLWYFKMNGEMSIYYDEEGDYLEIFIGEPRANYGEEVAEGITFFKDEKTDEIIGIGIINFRKSAKNLPEFKINLPLDIGLFAKKIKEA